jgi:hypothetical protein
MDFFSDELEFIFRQFEKSLLFLPVEPLSLRLTGVSRGNHIGGGVWSFKDSWAALAIPDGASNGKQAYS